MYFSFDIGTKNFGIYIESVDNCPLFLDNMSVKPYNFEKLNNKIEEILELYTPTIVIIEKQMSINTTAIIVFAHLEAIFKLKQPNCQIEIVSSRKKKFNKPVKGLNYNARKKISIETATEYLSDFEPILKKFKDLKKKDDVADAICQLLDFKESLCITHCLKDIQLEKPNCKNIL